MSKYEILTIILFVTILSGCAATSTVRKTNQLAPGMPYEEVVQLLGRPKSSEFVDDKWRLKYSLHENRKGWVPYYLVFDKDTKRLASWYADEKEYQRIRSRGRGGVQDWGPQ
jgi:outer membrane protein assembly factor BamE (lipoprotein component of BamABCDE complex)